MSKKLACKINTPVKRQMPLEASKIKMSKKRPRKEIVKFIALYRENECLWNIHCSTYKRADLKKTAYEIIGKEMKMSVDDVKKRIRSLRNTYALEKKKVFKSKQSVEDEEDLYEPQLFWFDKMEFLDSAIGLKSPHFRNEWPSQHMTAIEGKEHNMKRRNNSQMNELESCEQNSKRSQSEIINNVELLDESFVFKREQLLNEKNTSQLFEPYIKRRPSFHTDEIESPDDSYEYKKGVLPHKKIRPSTFSEVFLEEALIEEEEDVSCQEDEDEEEEEASVAAESETRDEIDMFACLIKAKLKRMNEEQRSFSESLIMQILGKGVLNHLTASTQIMETYY